MLLLLLLLASATVKGQDLPCGTFPVPPPPTSRIINGTQQDIQGQFPWVVSLQEEEIGGFRHFCGGSLISENWVVTSAQCVTLLDGLANYRIAAGVHDMAQPNGNEQYFGFTLEHVTIHPDAALAWPYENDVAVIQLNTPANFSSQYVGSVCLPADNQMIYVENPNCYLAGWGELDDGSMPSMLHFGTTDLMRDWQCMNRDWPGIVNILDSNVCIFNARQPNRGPCTGDQGGPVHCMVDAHFDLAAVISSWPPVCNEDDPALCQRTAFYLDWITSTTGVPPRPPPNSTSV